MREQAGKGVMTCRIRVRKADSAYVYFILESHEGMTGYTTLDAPPEAPYRELELVFTNDFKEDLEEVLEALSGELELAVISPVQARSSHSTGE